MTEQQQQGVPMPPDVQAILGQMGERFGYTIQPLVDLIRARDEVLSILTPRAVALQESLADVLALLERRGVQANWATEVRTLEVAKALLADQPPNPEDDPR